MRNLTANDKPCNFALIHDEYQTLIRKYANFKNHPISVYKKEEKMVLKAFWGLIDLGLVCHVSNTEGLDQFRIVTSNVNDYVLETAVADRDDFSNVILTF